MSRLFVVAVFGFGKNWKQPDSPLIGAVLINYALLNSGICAAVTISEASPYERIHMFTHISIRIYFPEISC